jgi:SAM-dependent methyltransferase
VRRDDIERRIASFPLWHYEFDLRGLKTPLHSPVLANRHAQRARYFFDPLVAYFGGSLKGKRVLDLGCNAGFWALKAIEAGCDFVLGVDARRSNIEQARLVFAAMDVPPDRFAFVVDDVLRLDTSGHPPFDIVLNLGLLYHVGKPIELLEVAAAVNSDVLLIDTVVSTLPGCCLELTSESTDSPLHAVNSELVVHPTASAVVEMTRALGYRTVILEPDLTDTTGCGDYTSAARRAFVCAKRSDLTDGSFRTERLDRLEALRLEAAPC